MNGAEALLQTAVQAGVEICFANACNSGDRLLNSRIARGHQALSSALQKHYMTPA